MTLNLAENVVSELSPSSEPNPIWPGAPRYAPIKAFPEYGYVTGQNPHPTRNKEGHSFGAKRTVQRRLTLDNWNEQEEYLWGVDLYNQGFIWESAYVWMGFFELSEKDSFEANFLQGLISNIVKVIYRVP